VLGLPDALNCGIGRAPTETMTGGKGGGGAKLMPLSKALVAHYAEIERRLNAAAQAELIALHCLIE
jgi:molybdate transport system regulatory protein